MQSAAVDRANEQAEQSTRALAQLQSQAVDERRHAAAREAATTAAAAAHRRAVNEAVGRLNAATEEVRNGLSQVVEMETASVSRLQQHEAFRARTARMLVLNAHRGVMARCYRAWRRHTAQIVGSKMLDDGATAAMAELRNRSLALALGGADGGSGLGGVMVSEYMKATLGALEDEWLRKEAAAEAEAQGLREELAAARTLAMQQMDQSEAQKSRLDRQAASLAIEGEGMRRAAAVANEAARKAEVELSRLRSHMDESSSGGYVDAAKLRVQKLALESEVSGLRQTIAAEREAAAAESGEMRAKLKQAEVRRLALQQLQQLHAAKPADAAPAGGDASREAAEAAAAAAEAGARAAAAEQKAADLEARLARAEEQRADEAAANARWVSELGVQLRRAQQAQGVTRALELHDELAISQAEVKRLAAELDAASADAEAAREEARAAASKLEARRARSSQRSARSGSAHRHRKARQTVGGSRLADGAAESRGGAAAPPDRTSCMSSCDAGDAYRYSGEGTDAGAGGGGGAASASGYEVSSVAVVEAD